MIDFVTSTPLKKISTVLYSILCEFTRREGTTTAVATNNESALFVKLEARI